MGFCRRLKNYTEIVKDPSELERIAENYRDFILKNNFDGMNLQLYDTILRYEFESDFFKLKIRDEETHTVCA